MQRRRNRFQTLTEQTMASLKECSEEVKRDSGKREGWIMGEMAEKGLRVRERKEKGERAKRVQGERQAARGRAGEEEKG